MPCQNTTCAGGNASPEGAISENGQCYKCILGSFSDGGPSQCQNTTCPAGSEPTESK